MCSGEETVPADNAFDPATHITFEDLSVWIIRLPHQFVKLGLKSSKTDSFRRWLTWWWEEPSTSFGQWRQSWPISRVGRNPGGFFFQFEDRRLLTKSRFVNYVRDGLKKIGLHHKEYAGHSFHIGASLEGTCLRPPPQHKSKKLDSFYRSPPPHNFLGSTSNSNRLFSLQCYTHDACGSLDIHTTLPSFYCFNELYVDLELQTN